jgi:hypothetical protein
MDRRCIQNALLFIERQHPPCRSLAKFVEVFDLGRRILRDVLSLHRKIQHALQTLEFSIDRRSFHCLSGFVLRCLLPAFIAVGFDKTYRDVFQFSVTEERFQNGLEPNDAVRDALASEEYLALEIWLKIPRSVESSPDFLEESPLAGSAQFLRVYSQFVDISGTNCSSLLLCPQSKLNVEWTLGSPPSLAQSCVAESETYRL